MHETQDRPENLRVRKRARGRNRIEQCWVYEISSWMNAASIPPIEEKTGSLSNPLTNEIFYTGLTLPRDYGTHLHTGIETVPYTHRSGHINHGARKFLLRLADHYGPTHHRRTGRVTDFATLLDT